MNHNMWKGVKMGIIANYKYLSDKNLKELKAFYSEENETFEKTTVPMIAPKAEAGRIVIILLKLANPFLIYI